MKRVFILAVMVVTLASTAFAAPPADVSAGVMAAFNKRFSNAHQVEWTETKTFYRARFIMEEELMYAYYEPAGNLIAVTRNVSIKQLPIALSQALETKYEQYWIADIFEVCTDAESKYYATLRSKKWTLVLQASPGGSWMVYKKEKV